MRVGLLRVVESARLYGDTYITWFRGEELVRGAAPGQFLMLRCADPLVGAEAPLTGASLADDPLLPRAMSYHRLRDASTRPGAGGADGLEFAILYDVVGRGTAWLARRQPGDQVFAWGPLGRGFSLRGPAENLLLVGGGIGVAPLVWLAEEAVAKGKSVVLIDGARSADGVFPAHLLPPEVEVVATTEDGSLGRRGRVTDVFLDYYGWADAVFACGPNAMFAALAALLRAHEGPSRARRRLPVRQAGKPVQALLESAMGCGTGICYGCAVFDRRGEARLVCKDGPRFELREIW
jgi:dihydroorotate dehydrogenase electron transfer subunit